MTPMSQASPHTRAHTPGLAWGAPPGSARAPTPGRQQQEADPPISQYDIINESNPVLKQRKRVELAQALQSNWTEQIKEKERMLKVGRSTDAHVIRCRCCTGLAAHFCTTGKRMSWCDTGSAWPDWCMPVRGR